MLATTTRELRDPQDNTLIQIKEDITTIETDVSFRTSNFHPEIFTQLFVSESQENVDEDFSQVYFLTDQWQEIEKQSDVDIKMGRVKSFNSVDDLIAELNS